jgi:hypothetical protein
MTDTVERIIQDSINSRSINEITRKFEILGLGYLQYEAGVARYHVSNVASYDAKKDTLLVLDAKGMETANKQMVQDGLKSIHADQIIQDIDRGFKDVESLQYFYKMSTKCTHFFSRDRILRKKGGFIASIDFECWSRDETEDWKSVLNSSAKMTEYRFYGWGPVWKGEVTKEICPFKCLRIPKKEVIKSLSLQEIGNRIRLNT